MLFYIKKIQNVNRKVYANIYLNKSIIFYINKWKKVVNNNKKIWKIWEINVDQDNQSHKMRYLSDCVYWTYLFKLIKDNRNRNIK